MEFLYGLLLLFAIAVLAVWLFIFRQGDADFHFIVDQRTDFVLEDLAKEAAVFSCRVPFVNRGTQDGTLMDVYPRHLLPCEYFDGVDVDARITVQSNPRRDGYWEAMIIPKTNGDTIIVTVKLTAKNGDIRQTLKDMVDMPIDIVYQVVARGSWYIKKSTIIMTADEVLRALNSERAAV